MGCISTDEIKRLDPPYNVQLRSGDRSAWFASSDFRDAVPAPDAAHRIGPLPSERALSSLPALIALAEGADAAPLRAAALAVPAAFVPNEALFLEGWAPFAARRLGGTQPTGARRLLAASLALWLERRGAEPEPSAEESAPDSWDLARVSRRLERSLVQTGLRVRRARLLCLLASATVAFREHGANGARVLMLAGADVVKRETAEHVLDVGRLAPASAASLHERRSAFDATRYDRLRVLVTELRRILDEGGDVALRVGILTIASERLARLMRTV